MGLEDDQARTDAEERQAFVRHELRTPLAVMRPVLDLLLDGTAGELDEKQRGYLRMLDRNIDRLGAMITSLVEGGWLEAAAVPAAAAAVPVGELIESTVADVRAALDERPRLDVRHGDGPVLRGDPLRLRRALRNVLLNACLYTPPGGRVTVTTSRAPSGEGALIVVTDTGRGIAPDEVPSVFDFGFRGQASRASGDSGLGLGLFVAREIVESHGGRIWLESTLGEGTRVSLELPAVAG
jgi:signal transduction histidine kinase